jgi:pseudaminic acid biosynthesis-associated methylase
MTDWHDFQMGESTASCWGGSLPRTADKTSSFTPVSMWAGKFGDDYTARNSGENLPVNNRLFFEKCFARLVAAPSAVLELGANRGDNIKALMKIWPAARFHAVEINWNAVKQLRQLPNTTVTAGSLLDCEFGEFQFDLVITKGVLIHMVPSDLPRVYETLYNSSRRYILMAEYYNPTPVEVPYRSRAGLMWKRDFAGEFMDRYPVRLVDYGFSYHRDVPNMDDLTWFLMEKK